MKKKDERCVIVNLATVILVSQSFILVEDRIYRIIKEIRAKFLDPVKNLLFRRIRSYLVSDHEFVKKKDK